MLRYVKTAKERGCKAVNVELPLDLHKRASIAANQRNISLRLLIINGLHAILNDDNIIKIDENGKVHNDLYGVFSYEIY